MELEAHIRHLYGPEEVPYELDELLVVCLVRDGRPYLKSFLEHYFSLGVKHVVFLDNGSTDGTVETLRTYENVTVLHSELSFREQKNPLRRYLINRFGRGRWILYVDIDELFEYPYSDVVNLSSFLRYLTENSYTAVVAQMLDMFPEEPVADTPPELEDEPLKKRHRFYDISSITGQRYYSRSETRNELASDEIEIYRDGINWAVFKQRALLTKHPLIFLDEQIKPIYPGPHWVEGASIADITCVLYHYKFAGRFYEKTVRAVREENYVNDSVKYKKFLKALEQNPTLQIKRKNAQELRDVSDLVDNQFLVVSADYIACVDAEERKSVSGDDGYSGDGGPHRLVEAFSKASTRARNQARAARVLSRQVEILEGRVKELENSLSVKERRRLETLERRNRSLEDQIQAVHNSRSWKLLGELARFRSRIRGKGEP